MSHIQNAEGRVPGKVAHAGPPHESKTSRSAQIEASLLGDRTQASLLGAIAQVSDLAEGRVSHIQRRALRQAKWLMRPSA